MALILNIEKSTKNCSISISKNGILLILTEENNKNYIHSKYLHKFLKSILEVTGILIYDLNAICINKGPCYYTVLIIGASTAKGFCFFLKITLISIDSFTLLIEKIITPFLKKKYIIFL